MQHESGSCDPECALELAIACHLRCAHAVAATLPHFCTLGGAKMRELGPLAGHEILPGLMIAVSESLGWAEVAAELLSTAYGRLGTFVRRYPAEQTLRGGRQAHVCR